MRVTFASVALAALMVCGPVRAERSANEILKASGVQGGLVVHLGCDEGTLTTSLRANDGMLVEGLDADAKQVDKTRTHIASAKLSGKVTATVFDGQHLPYIDNLVNLLVVSDSFSVSRDEMMRVLCPGGVAVIAKTMDVVRKPVGGNIDEWTHYLHDPQGSSVSNDEVCGHPRGMQWAGGPLWARSHEHSASMQAMVSSGGRVFYVMDEGPIASIQLPPKFFLTARDAFNGVVLWKRPLHDWFNSLYPLKSGPGWMPRRLVSVGDRVYVAPGIGQDLLCLDATTGELLHTYKDTNTTFELIVSEGVILAAVDRDEALCDYHQENADCWKERDRASKRWQWDREKGTRVVVAIQADSGELLWERKMPVAPMTLTANHKMVCFFDGDSIIALDRKNGTELWNTDVVDLKQIPTGYSGPRMILREDRILFSPTGKIVALDPKTGEIVWKVDKKPRSGHFSLEDFYAIGDKVWALKRGNNGGYVTYNVADGSPRETYDNPIKSFYIHQRCYPGRATVKYQLPPMMGVMVYDMKTNEWSNNHWVRGGCIYGVMPANGLIYAPPHACACYYQSKLNGFSALSPVAQSAKAPAAETRLKKGPAYGKIDAEAADSDAAWPTFRHDSARSAYVRTDVAADVNQAWKKEFGTKLSQPVVVGKTVFVSAVETHTVYALDATSGQEVWHFIAGGRVNSPPTIYQGLALFGCADGCIYALRASDGEVAWTFQAAPSDRKMVSCGQLESVWPLAGSVLIQDGKLYCVAGRSMFLDGGLRMILLNPVTGELISENVMDRHVPDANKELDDLLMGKHMPVAMPDILSGDGHYVYMKSQTFTPDGKRVRVVPQRPDTQYDQEVHLFSPISFLDDTWHQRTYWIFGRAAGEGWAEFQFPPKRVPCGRILCLDEKNAYGYARDPELVCNTSVSEYRLYSAGKYPERKVGIPKLEGTWVKGKYSADNPLASNSVDWKKLAQLPPEKLSALSYNWIQEQPDVMARAMVLANDHLFVAGPRDVADEKALWGHSNEKSFKDAMAQQAAWLNGEHGGVLQVFSKTDGKKLAERPLDRLPAFDGLIAANGRLFVVNVDGSLACLKAP